MEKLNALEVANSPAIWALASIAVIAVLVETILFLRLARKAAGMKEISLTKKQCNRALRAGVVSAIGPAFGVFIVMIGLISVLGGPISWLRLSVIGGATTELTAATVGAVSYTHLDVYKRQVPECPSPLPARPVYRRFQKSG